MQVRMYIEKKALTGIEQMYLHMFAQNKKKNFLTFGPHRMLQKL
jgi:hypothetical protein